MQAALDIRRVIATARPDQRDQTMPARLVSAWLTHNRGPRLAATTARLCQYVIDQPDLTRQWHVEAWDQGAGTRPPPTEEP